MVRENVYHRKPVRNEKAPAGGARPRFVLGRRDPLDDLIWQVQFLFRILAVTTFVFCAVMPSFKCARPVLIITRTTPKDRCDIHCDSQYRVSLPDRGPLFKPQTRVALIGTAAKATMTMIDAFDVSCTLRRAATVRERDFRATKRDI